MNGIQTAAQAFQAGLFTGLGLIVAIGPQNLFVLRQAIADQAKSTVVLVSIASDALLILLGVLGLGGVSALNPRFLWWSTLLGCFVVVGFTIRSLSALCCSADGGSNHSIQIGMQIADKRRAALTALGFSLLNPQALIDTVFLLGAASAIWSTQRGWFALGAIFASIVWFSMLGLGGFHLRALLEKTVWQRRLQLFVSIIMCKVCFDLLLAFSRLP